DIDEDLAQACRIRLHDIRNRFADSQVEIKSFRLHRLTEERGHLGQESRQFKGRLLEFEMSRLHLGEIEDIVDDTGQRLTVTANDIVINALLLMTELG